jgi:2-polyprenyl-3-methyl-5-hydroxy-6-metoxy-1,4-benzoquinol methylase
LITQSDTASADESAPGSGVAPAFRADLARSVRLFRAIAREQTNPDHYYGTHAADTVAQLRQYTGLTGATILDVGGGAGYFTEALRAVGAHVVCIDCDAGELRGRGGMPAGSVLGSALALPFADGAADICLSSNVLEHVPQPERMADEMVRVTRPGGIVYLSYTNWMSPWGGHETSPWHYLGGDRAARRYQRRTGRAPKNRFGESLYAVSVAQAVRWARARSDVDILSLGPRDHPRWATWVVSVPGLREIVTWNLLLVLRKR